MTPDDSSGVDKVLAIIQATARHENTVETLAFRPESGEVVLTILQPNDEFQYPNYELTLTFSRVGSLHIDSTDRDFGREVTAIECTQEHGAYRAVISIGDRGSACYTIDLVFTGLRYKRSPSFP